MRRQVRLQNGLQGAARRDSYPWTVSSDVPLLLLQHSFIMYKCFIYKYVFKEKSERT